MLPLVKGWGHTPISKFLTQKLSCPKEEQGQKKNGAETEGRAIWGLPHLGIHPVCRHQTMTDTVAVFITVRTETDRCGHTHTSVMLETVRLRLEIQEFRLSGFHEALSQEQKPQQMFLSFGKQPIWSGDSSTAKGACQT